MKKYMKYEIKGSYKFILGIVAILVIASSLIQFNMYTQSKDLMNLSSGTTNSRLLMITISAFVIFGAFLTAFFHIIGSFKKELYEDRGYLTFTLPLTGNRILGGKLLIAMLWFAVLGLTIIIYNIVLAMILFGGSWMDIAKEIFSMINSGMISLGLIFVLSSIMTLILIYFSIALSRVSVRNKRIGGIWFVVFIILNALASYLTFKVSSAIPYYLSLDGFKVLHQYDITSYAMFNNSIGDLLVLGNNYGAYMNIAGVLSNIAISVAAFLGTGYLIEKKIDL